MFDTHCHIDLVSDTPEGRETTVRDAVAAGVGLMINVGVDAASSLAGRDLADKFDEVRFSAGFHPEILNESRGFANDPGILDGLAKHPKFAAVGEIGLDYFHNKGNSREQIGLLRPQLEFAVERGLPVILHTRDSWDDTFAVLEDYKGRGLRGVFHCFSGDYETAKKCLDLGFVVSFAGNLTYKNAAVLQDAARRLPLDKVLLETDSPYLTPVPKRGERNQPAYISHLYGFFAGLRGVGVPDLEAHHRRILSNVFPCLKDF
jgi:TatD DNase family protein